MIVNVFLYVVRQCDTKFTSAEFRIPLNSMKIVPSLKCMQFTAKFVISMIVDTELVISNRTEIKFWVVILVSVKRVNKLIRWLKSH